MTTKAVTTRLSYEDFTRQAIVKLRDTKPRKNKAGKAVPASKGIHTVFSGFNTAFTAYYGKDVSPVDTVQKLVKDGKIALKPSRRGVMIYLLEDAPITASHDGKDILAIILGK